MGSVISNMAMSREIGEIALDEVFDQIRHDYYLLLRKVEDENKKAMAELEDKLVVDKSNFLAKQERERRLFETKLSRDKVEFELRQDEEKRKVEMETAKRKEQVTSFVRNVRSKCRVINSRMPLRTESEIRDEFVCPVCFMDMKPPIQIYQCTQGHPICQHCKSRPEVTQCPTCRERLVGRAFHIEKIAGKVFMDDVVNESKKDFPRTSAANHDNEMQVFFRVNGKSIILNIKPSDNIDDVKELLYKKVGIPSSKQWFVFGGKLVEGSKIVSDIGIQKESTIHVNVRK